MKFLELESRAGEPMDTIGNLLTSIRNASAKGKERTDVPFSKLKVEISKILKDEGYISGYRIMEENHKPFVRIQLKYTDEQDPVISGIKRVSRPGLKIYQKADKNPRVNGGMGIAIISTSKGVMTNRKAYKIKAGGEVLCHVW